MEIKDLLSKYTIPKPTKSRRINERGELLKKFVDRLNSDRNLAGFKPLGFSSYIKMMSEAGVRSLQDLYVFYGSCNDAKNFSSFWWWYIKTNKKQKNDR